MTKPRSWILGLTLIVISAGLSQPAEAAPSAAKLKKIQTLLELTGAKRVSRGIAVQMIARIRSAFPKVPESFWRKQVLQADVKGLLRQMARVYARHLTDQDVAALLAFYQSPVGRRFVKLQPKLMRESMGLGRAWGQQLAKRVADQLKEKGYIKGRTSGGKPRKSGGKPRKSGGKSGRKSGDKSGGKPRKSSGKSGGLRMR